MTPLCPFAAMSTRAFAFATCASLALLTALGASGCSESADNAHIGVQPAVNQPGTNEPMAAGPAPGPMQNDPGTSPPPGSGPMDNPGTGSQTPVDLPDAGGDGIDPSMGPDGTMPMEMPDAGSESNDFAEDHRDDCTIPSMPVAGSLPSKAALPDPFKMMNGTPITSRAQWKCRREEVAAMLEHYELGEKPRKPENVTASMSGSTMSITVTDMGKRITFSVNVTKPAGDGPFPVIIGFYRMNMGPALGNLPVAAIDYTTGDYLNANAPNQMAKDGGNLRGQGLFYDLYGRDHSAGALMAWAWGTSRIIDALEAHPEFGLDPKRVGVTGCSRYGKGSLVAGAFDERIALTIVQEGGSGGCSAWRAIAFEKSQGKDIELLSNVSGGSNWFRDSFDQSFGDSSTDRIPYDHHQLAGLIAPRALLNVEQDAIEWLGPGASYVNNSAAREIFRALGAEEAHTYSMSAGHEHCTLPQSQYHWVASYAKKYLLGEEGEAAAIETTGDFTFDRDKWIDWTTPNL